MKLQKPIETIQPLRANLNPQKLGCQNERYRDFPFLNSQKIIASKNSINHFNQTQHPSEMMTL